MGYCKRLVEKAESGINLVRTNHEHEEIPTEANPTVEHPAVQRNKREVKVVVSPKSRHKRVNPSPSL